MELSLDINQELKNTENYLRDFLSFFLDKHEPDWLSSVFRPEKINTWKERQNTDKVRIGYCDPRLLYYSDFYDLKTIFEKKGNILSSAFPSIKDIIFYLTKLEGFRNYDSHRRELFLYQKYLIIGITGEIKMQIIKYSNKQESSEDYYPRITYAADSLGNIYDLYDRPKPTLNTKKQLRPGDRIEFTVTASDPKGRALKYGLSTCSIYNEWQDNGNFSIDILNKHIGERFIISLCIKSPENYHRYGQYDDDVRFEYEVLPPQIENFSTNQPS